MKDESDDSTARPARSERTENTDKTKAPGDEPPAPAREIVLGAIADVRDVTPPAETPAEELGSPPTEGQLTPQGRSQRLERRSEERHDIPGLLAVEIELFGYQRDARSLGFRRAPEADKKIHSSGTTVNLSLGGMLARVGDPVVEGSHCLVRFVNAGESVQPELRWGVALRCKEVAPGAFEVAVQFSSPLEHIDTDALAVA